MLGISTSEILKFFPVLKGFGKVFVNYLMDLALNVENVITATSLINDRKKYEERYRPGLLS